MSQRQLKHIYWFAYYNLKSPSVRYRAKYPLDYAKNHQDISSDLIIPSYSFTLLFKFLKAYFSALLFPKDNSLIVIQRVQSNFIYANLLKLLVRLRASICVYDLDDADYLEVKPNTIHYLAKNCQYLTVGSKEIENYLKDFNPNIVQLTSPTPDLEIVKKERNEILNIGWIGGYGWGHKDTLNQLVFPAVKSLDIPCRFTLLGIIKNEDEEEIRKYFAVNENVELEIPRNINWNDERDLQFRIKSFDIGVATLLDHPIQLAKSGIKAKQYMNNSVPVLCNDLPENNKVIEDGFNGFICNSISDFRKRILEIHLMNDTDYWELASNARNSIQNFNHVHYLDVLEGLVLKLNRKKAEIETVSV